MAAFFKKKSSRKAKDQQLPVKNENAGRGADRIGASHFFETSRVVETGLFLLFTALVVIICFLGQKSKGPQVILGHPAASRIVAEFAFQQSSKVLLEEQKHAVRAQVPPVFQRTFEPYDEFRANINELNTSIAKTLIDHEAEGDEAVAAELEATAKSFIETTGLKISPKRITQFTNQTNPRERSVLTNDALNVLKSLYEDGIYSNLNTDGKSPQVTMIQLIDEEGRYNLPSSRSYDDALVALRVRLDALSANRTTARALFDIFRAGLHPNLLYSASGTNRAIERAISEIEPPVIEYKEGDTLVEPGSIITELDIECLKTYRKVEREHRGNSLIFNGLFLERVTLTLILLVAVMIFVKRGLRNFHKRNRAIAITAVSILLNLLIIRLIMEIGDIALLNNRPSLGMLPYIAPYALAPMIVAVLVGTAPAVITALIIAVLFGIIQGNSVEFLLIAFLSGVVGSFISANIRKRAMLVRAGLMAGIASAMTGALLGLLGNLSIGLVGQQAIIALIVGVLSGVLAVGLLPIFEQAFQITTEITLLELTDFNHPLLRRMQMEAPGTYHHSLMVANLSENAAAAIGASPLLCRVCCLFHDIGKLVKPEYFAENQKDGINPHNEKNPSMSALVIKAHVKEGVEIARKHKLPRVIIDVIRQHHGTGLIHFFYHQAQQEQNKQTKLPFPEKTGKIKESKKVDESTYRYDGPRPAFKESAIIFFADGVEAASRSLKKVTQPAIEELIDSMFKSRIADGQLDECPLTFKELHEIRSSFTYTLLNMLHSRVEYPKEINEKQAKADSKKSPQDNEPSPSGNKQPV
ncbi:MULTISPECIES: HD family phosphohydrolase [unclassified Lentimonas]|uniref:HD family phosphohydrolase n=1 Tax=unclassified Lentimonas TaxID=2630993 RepID=UPI001326ADD0|nr:MULTISPECIES: HDIG domain-containing metalloprotein [unclassified Lentimonas]CAA6680128.1 Membrane protein containing HD superfamily hydrolase domain, YQFF ortholog [Lentimonas sp. CC4]CAA6687519.1 Membrane protein containing HD superfamily hydrolase domain, YQFF ortholog [Lentimonas sp. CC6]CAA6693434.1 Membrane protein containing HD superfamily hydrolase domain, YQFF ortholog [Lentimonas sp. CC19]CAA6695735.1 Membrane protein containing HD superfamily hydrolase domain, YQFF ortholog [Lenti